MKALVSLLLVFLLMGCTPEQHARSRGELVFEQEGIVLTLGPAPLEVEEVLFATLSLTEGLTLVSAELRGLTMNMGRIPLRFEQSDGLYKSEFVLGACSEPKMQWQLELVLAKGAERSALEFPFYSTWPK